jgi:phage tail sheath protein FI
MPVNVTYPGVYIEEIQSGVRTIVGVSTSITAFLGGASMGPTDSAVTVLSWSDFARRFGDLDVGYPMTYAVRDFFLNGGSQAVIIRLYAAPAGGGTALLPADTLQLQAASPGSWGDALLALVDDQVSEETAISWGLAKADLFNLTVWLGPGGVRETFYNLTVKESPQRVDRVLLAGSALVRVQDPSKLGATAPKPNGSTDKPYTVKTNGADGGTLGAADYSGNRNKRTGKYLLEDVDLFNLVCLLGNSRGETVAPGIYADMLAYCVERRAFLIVDAPVEWTHDDLVSNATAKVTGLGLTGLGARNAAVFYPRVQEADPQRNGQVDTFPACGLIAGAMAQTDGNRGVWKAPAGIDVGLTGTSGLADSLTDRENGVLNQVAINALRAFPIVGRVIWGARTLRGADLIGDDYKYIPVRRTALFLEESLYRGLKWVVFEPNDEPLWAQIRLNVGAFMHSLFVQGAFQGTTPNQAYFVKCDKDTTTQDDINKGIVNILVGFAPLKPAEFVVVQLQQLAGQIDT